MEKEWTFSMYSSEGQQKLIWHNLIKMIYPGFSLREMEKKMQLEVGNEPYMATIIVLVHAS